MRFFIEFQPAISQECKTYIKTHLKPIYNNEESSLWDLLYIYETLDQEISLNNQEEIFGIKLKDIEELKKLVDEEVDYIEF